MGSVRVVEKDSVIDGKPIKWKVLEIQGFMSGELHSLDIKLNKTEAAFAKMLLSSNETAGEVKTSKGGNVDIQKKSENWFED